MYMYIYTYMGMLHADQTSLLTHPGSRKIAEPKIHAYVCDTTRKTGQQNPFRHVNTTWLMWLVLPGVAVTTLPNTAAKPDTDEQITRRPQ